MTWVWVSQSSVTYSTSLVSDGYVLAGYVDPGYISSSNTWSDVTQPVTVWA